MSGKRLLAAIFAVALVCGIVPSSPALPKTTKTESHHAKASPAPVAIEPFEGVCDTANITDVFSNLESEHNKDDEIALLQGRIVSCSRRIAEFLAHQPAPSPTPYWISALPAPAPTFTPAPVCATSPPPVTSSAKTIALYETLSRCFGYYTYLTTLPSPGPSDTPAPLARIASRPTFYVYAVGATDPVAAAVLIHSVIARLTKALRPGSDLQIAGRADWTANANFAAQCQQDPNTRDALVIETSINQASTLNYLLVTTQIANITASAEVLGCGPDYHKPSASPLSLISENGLTGKAHQTGLVVGLLSAIASFFLVDKAMTTVSAGPPVSVTSTVRTAPQLNGDVLGYYQGQNLNLPAQNPSVQVAVASERLANDAMNRLQLFCIAPALTRLANDARPKGVADVPPEHRTVLYQAAALYMDDCARFNNFK